MVHGIANLSSVLISTHFGKSNLGALLTMSTSCKTVHLPTVQNLLLKFCKS